MYQVLARKWRPRTLEELIGQQHVARTLRNAIGAGRVAHAYLFAGVRGTGKTTVARILAKCLNCEKGPTATPCGECAPCREIAEGRSLDVIEIDAASRTSVDDVRELQEVIAYAPARDRNKILIIDEVHMLSKSAFNALLKTLEEPPARVVFVLATTELHKVLATILSRCQLFEFRRVPAGEVAAHLRKLCDAEGIKISDRALDRVARAGEGSVRDSLSVLERVLAFCGTDVDDDEALALLGAVRVEVLASMLQAAAARDAATLLGAFDATMQEGHDLVHLWGELVGVVRDLLLVRTMDAGPDVLSRSPEEIRTLDGAAAHLSREDLTRIFQLLADLEPGLKASSQPRFLFESCLIRIASLATLRPIEELLAALEPGSPLPVTFPSPGAGRAASRPAGPESQKKNAPLADPPADLSRAVLAAVHDEKPLLAAALDGGGATLSVDAGALVARVGQGSDSLRRLLEREDNLRALGEIAGRVAGRSVPVRIVVAADPPPLPGEPSRREPAPQGAAPTSRPRPAIPDRDDRQALFDRVRRDPAVRTLLDEFGATIVDVRPLDPLAGGEDDAPTAAEEPA